MMFREKGKKILCMRSEYVPDIKRTKAVTVASLDRWQSTVPDEVRQHLTEGEVASLQDWLSKRTDKKTYDRRKYDLSTVARDVRYATEALAIDDLRQQMTADRAAEIYAAMDGLKKALRKAGFAQKDVQYNGQSTDLFTGNQQSREQTADRP